MMKSTNNPHNALDFRYHAKGQVFRVTEQDAVRAVIQGKEKVIGYNHDRAWTAARSA